MSAGAFPRHAAGFWSRNGHVMALFKLAGVTITKPYKQTGVKNRYSRSQVSGAWMSEIKVSAGRASPGVSPLGLQAAPSHWVPPWPYLCARVSLASLSYKDTRNIRSGPHREGLI